MLIQHIVDYILQEVAMKHMDVVITGHSLGGAMAKAVALVLSNHLEGNVNAVSFSGPGVVYLEHRFTGVQNKNPVPNSAWYIL